MEIDSFSQCLQYLQAITPEKGQLERYVPIPIASALFGGILGFGLNALLAKYKEESLDANRVMCCSEEVQRIKEALELTLLELMNLASQLVAKIDIATNQLPTKISSPYISKHFTDAAHKHTKEQRSCIQSMIEHIDSLNNRLPFMHEPEKTFVSFDTSVHLLNSSGDALKAWRCCQGFIDKKVSIILEDQVNDQLILMGATQEQVDARALLAKNARSHNSVLRL